MKLHGEVLLEIISMFQKGILEETDISELMRELDLEQKDGLLVLTEEYKKARE